MINFIIPLERVVYNFLIAQLDLNDLGAWDFNENHWFGRLIKRELMNENDSKNYAKLGDCICHIKINYYLDNIIITERAVYNINKEIKYRIDEYLFEWVRSRCSANDSDHKIKNTILSFMDYYSISDEMIEMDTLKKRFSRCRSAYNIPLKNKLSNGDIN